MEIAIMPLVGLDIWILH